MAREPHRSSVMIYHLEVYCLVVFLSNADLGAVPYYASYPAQEVAAFLGVSRTRGHTYPDPEHSRIEEQGELKLS